MPAMGKTSAGILVHRTGDNGPEFLLVHPGGPFWANKDDGAWSIPKGEYDDGEEPLDAAVREFAEETGFEIAGPLVPLGTLRQRSGKRVSAWLAEADFDEAAVTSNSFTMEWPPASGRQAEFPEVDRAEWFDVATARRKLLPGLAGFIDEACRCLGC
jgi:predicted NUDIX family NTP pyrophosphohydrolase